MTTAQARNRPDLASTPAWTIISLILLATAIVLYAQEAATSATPTRSVIWGSLALAAYLLGLMCLIGRGQSPLRGLASWKFGPWILLWYSMTFGLATITWSRPQPPPEDQIAIESVLQALRLMAIGMTLWMLGYLVGPGKLLQRLVNRGLTVVHNSRTAVIRGRFTPWGFYAIGVAARIVTTVTTGRFGYVGNPASAISSATGYEQVLSEISLLCPLAICAAAPQLYKERLPGARLTLVVLLVIEIAFGAAAGGKQSFVIALLAVVIPRSAALYRLPKLALIGGILIFLIIIIPFNQSYRNAIRGGTNMLSTSQAIHDAPTILRQSVTSQGLFTTVAESATYLMQRIEEIGGPAIILQRTPGQIPFISPAQLLVAPLAESVPRAIWHNKPILAPGYQFSQQYYGIPPTIYTSSAISPIGDLYRHGGWLPVMAGMFIFGCGMRLLDNTFDIRTSPHSIFLILLLFPSLVKGEDDWVTFAASIPAIILIWLFTIALAFRAKHPSRLPSLPIS